MSVEGGQNAMLSHIQDFAYRQVGSQMHPIPKAQSDIKQNGTSQENDCRPISAVFLSFFQLKNLHCAISRKIAPFLNTVNDVFSGDL